MANSSDFKERETEERGLFLALVQVWLVAEDAADDNLRFHRDVRGILKTWKKRSRDAGLGCSFDVEQESLSAPAAGVAGTIMVRFEDGSVVWARSHPKEKFWPSVIFHTWEAAKEAGFVLDGIAFLIEAGRKIDVTDDEASPREGEVLNL